MVGDTLFDLSFKGRELWQADGTTGGTVEIPGSFREPRELTVAGPWLFFAATDPAHGRELWALE